MKKTEPKGDRKEHISRGKIINVGGRGWERKHPDH